VVPLFFILSGLSLSVVYGDRAWPEDGARCCGTSKAGAQDPEAASPKARFDRM
jgi:hypothetical protein